MNDAGLSSHRSEPTTDVKTDEKADVVEPVVSADLISPTTPAVELETVERKPVKKSKTCQKPHHKKPNAKKKRTMSVQKSRSRKAAKHDSESETSGSDSDGSSMTSSEESLSSSSEDESSEEDRKKQKKSAKAKKAKKPKDKKKRRKSKAEASESDADDSDSEAAAASGSESDASSSRKKSKKLRSKVRKAAESDSGAEESASADDKADMDALETQLADLMSKVAELKKSASKKRRASTSSRRRSVSDGKAKSKARRKSVSDALEYKRVDQLWDSSTHNYTLKESAEEDDGEFAEFAFLVRRKFDWENKYLNTVVDIKSKQLRAVLQVVMKDCKSVSLEAEEPTMDPNILFLYLEELRTYYKKTLRAQIKAESKKKRPKKKLIKQLEQQRSLCKTIVQYIDEDYADTKKTLYPLLEAGNITFDLLWAIFTPNDIAVTSAYGHWEEPRCFQVDYAHKYSSMTRGEWYTVEGRYLEYDGKSYGYGDFEVDIESFKGPRKITSLAAFPLRFHRDPEGLRKKLIERGRRFVALDGMRYMLHNGIAFMKKKKQVLKININGRVMVDPATFRRINANYPISLLKPKEDMDDLFTDDEDEDCSCCPDSDSDDGRDSAPQALDQLHAKDEDSTKVKYKWVTNEDGDEQRVAVEVDEDGAPLRPECLDVVAGNTADGQAQRRFTDDQLLLTSPVVLGFAFSEKLWLEFSLSGIKEITYNDKAFESLVLPPDQKKTIHALVNSHKFHGARAIDDVVQGKGKGLVAVLHGPPGTGKTLTAEGISELLRCPLYMVSAGELGTDPARLEPELQKILDVAHAWGAVLLLDEADVFLERRDAHDLHRNALVSIFLRLLEYFQGILFLTTNRVETFDDAFQSRIHVALKYGALTPAARRTVWKMFLDMAREADAQSGAMASKPDSSSSSSTAAVVASSITTTVTSSSSTAAASSFPDTAQLDWLSRKQLNGRQIKNLVRTAQALALNEGQALAMDHLRRVLDVAESFDRDLKGGSGYVDAMRSYT